MTEGKAWGIDRHDAIRFHGGYLCLFPNLSATQEIDALIVRNSEHPRPQRTTVVEGLKLAIGVEQRLLDDVLAVPLMREQ